MKSFVIARDAVEVHGPDAATFLQGQLSQDVVALAVGASALSFILQPQGKVDALVRVTRHDDERFVLDVEGGFGDAVVARLERFKLRVKSDLRLLGGWRCVAVRDGVVDGGLPAFWAAHDGVDLLGPDVEAPADLGSPTEYERLRIEAGFPAMGRELDERTIPEETGLVAAAASFTKGCYTGQELVARIDSRGGNVPRRLRGIRGSGLQVGDAVVVDGREAGVVTSAADDVALAYVRREVQPPVDAEVGARGARIEQLPLVS
jgi:tRNA-modifying protein YgfZ